MALIEEIKLLCDRLSPLGWRELMLKLTDGALDISKPTSAGLAAELTKALASISRVLPGFEDFSAGGTAAVTPGKPAESLLYHALASPLVIRDHLGNRLKGHATPAELDTLENYIFSLRHKSLEDLVKEAGGAPKVGLVVFSMEYRPASDTVDGRHADLVFSRTGIARVGTARLEYLPESRGFWPEDRDNPNNLRVLPARFALWLAVKSKGAASRVSPILGTGDDDDAEAKAELKRDFWIPYHKIFGGSECLVGADVGIIYQCRLLNIKIQKIHEFLGTTPLPEGYPFVIEDEQIGSMATDPLLGPGWVVPTVHRALVEPAIKNGEPVTFGVDPSIVSESGFAAVEPPSGSGVPEYIHARTRVRDGVFEDLNDEPDVRAEMRKGPYEALHYVDFTGEGWVKALLTGIPASALPVVPAYVLVSAPDFFPSSGQFELSEWSRSAAVPERFRASLWNIPPTPLSETRLPANLQLPGSPFKKSDRTITAVVGMGPPAGEPQIWPEQSDAVRVSHLPDDAAGVFAPGWDVSLDRLPGADNAAHLAAYALGSPFPEDAKLCAALSTFWPAVAPDVFRTFVNPLGNTNGTIAALTDEEIGQDGQLPWDGIAGPRIVTTDEGDFIEFASFLNSDYVQQALQNRFSIRLTSRITVEGYQERIIATCRAYSVLSNLGSLAAARNQWLILSFRAAANGDSALQTAQIEAGHVLAGGVFAIRASRLRGSLIKKVDARTERMPLLQPVEFFVSARDPVVLVKRSSDLKFGRAASEP